MNTEQYRDRRSGARGSTCRIRARAARSAGDDLRPVASAREAVRRRRDRARARARRGRDRCRGVRADARPHGAAARRRRSRRPPRRGDSIARLDDVDPVVRTGDGDPVVRLDDDALAVASRAAFDAALVDAAVRAGAVLERARVTDVSVNARGVTLSTTAGAPPRVVRRRRRRREQHRAPARRRAVWPRSAVDRHRLLRARHHERRDRHRIHRGSAGLHLVVPAAGSSRDRDLRAGRRWRDVGSPARARRALDRRDADRARRPAPAVRVADSVAWRPRSRSADGGRRTLGARGRRRRSRRPDHAGGDLLRARVGRLGRRRAVGVGRWGGLRGPCARRRGARAGARGAAQKGILQAAFCQPDAHGAAGERGYSRGARGSGCRPPALRDAEMATHKTLEVGLAWRALTA